LNQHYVFTKSNGVALLKMFLTSKVPRNEQDMSSLTDPCFNETHYIPGERNESKHDLREGLKRETDRLEKKFQQKYMLHEVVPITKRDDGKEVDEQGSKGHNGGEYCIREAMLAKEREA
jgi:hypothetical protein